MKIECLIAIAANSGHPFLCAICGGPILPGQRIAFDHRHASARGGANTVANLAPVHDAKSGELDCHTRKTAHPRGPHTAIGGDTFEAAKTDRLVVSQTEHAAFMSGEKQRPPSRLQGRSFPKREKSFGQSAGFRKLREGEKYQWPKRAMRGGVAGR